MTLIDAAPVGPATHPVGTTSPDGHHHDHHGPSDGASDGASEATPDAGAAAAEAFLGALTGYMTVQALSLGHRTGLLAAVRQGPGTSGDVAARAGAHERSTREWLSVLTAAGVLEHADGVFTLGSGHAALFDGSVLPFDPTVLLELMDVWGRVMPDLERAVLDGTGLPYAAYQPEFSVGQDALNGPLYEQFLVQDWVPSVPGLAERLAAGADVADLGCGGGRALCLLAAAFPASRFVGYDIDDDALALGRARADQQGLTNVRFEHRDVAEPGVGGALDVVLAVDAIHDQARPLDVVRQARHALAAGGVLLMVEPTAAGDLTTDAQDPMAVINYMTSLGHCVQVSLAQGGPGLGSMWGLVGASALLEEAGFPQVTHHDSACGYTVVIARP